MTCKEGHSFNSKAITTYNCGPDTDWKWNGIVDINVPGCSSMIYFFVRFCLQFES